jgi:hypothetical protein
MRRGGGSGRGAGALLPALVLAATLGATALLPPAAGGERSQRGDLVISLQGKISPLMLSRRRPDPIHLRLSGGLQSTDGSLLPRVNRVEIGFPTKGIVNTYGLPVCTGRRLRNATSAGAIDACRPALIGHGSVEADVVLPDQGPFRVHAKLLVFNGPRKDGHRLLLLHGYARQPPTTVVMPFTLVRGDGRFGIRIGADLPAALGPWPHLARFRMDLGRDYEFRGRRRSFLRATCPIPPRFTSGFFSLAQVSYSLADGRRISRAITRSCRAPLLPQPK